MNCWNIHPVLQIWLPLTSISSQNSNSSSLVSVFFFFFFGVFAAVECCFAVYNHCTCVKRGYTGQMRLNGRWKGLVGIGYRERDVVLKGFSLFLY
jgi:hypothetical protein